MAPAVMPNWPGVRIHRSCRINGPRRRIHWIFFNHYWRRYDDRAANYDGSRVLHNDRRHSRILVRVPPLIAWNLRGYRQIGRHCRRGESKCTRCTQSRFTHGRVPYFVSFVRNPLLVDGCKPDYPGCLIERGSVCGTCGDYRYLIFALSENRRFAHLPLAALRRAFRCRFACIGSSTGQHDGGVVATGRALGIVVLLNEQPVVTLFSVSAAHARENTSRYACEPLAANSSETTATFVPFSGLEHLWFLHIQSESRNEGMPACVQRRCDQ